MYLHIPDMIPCIALTLASRELARRALLSTARRWWHECRDVQSRCRETEEGAHLRRLCLVAAAVNHGAADKDAEARGLHQRPAVPALAEAGAEVVERKARKPHEERAHRLEHRAEDGAEVARDVHAHVVVREQAHHLHGEHRREVAVVRDHVQRVHRVLVNAVALLACTRSVWFRSSLFRKVRAG